MSTTWPAYVNTLVMGGDGPRLNLFAHAWQNIGYWYFMTKRRRPTHPSLSDDDWKQDQAISDISTDLESDSRDTSFMLKRQTRKSIRKPSKKARIMDDNSACALESESYEGSTHPSSLHSIRDPAPMRLELLKWYKTVQNKRRMPWRKPYDPNLAAEGRAQRAYEVCSAAPLKIHPCTQLCPGMGF